MNHLQLMRAVLLMVACHFWMIRAGVTEIHLSAPLDYQVHQRETAGAGRVSISGSLSQPLSEAATLEAQVLGGGADAPWHPLGSIDGGSSSFRSEFQVPAGGWYRLNVRLQRGQTTLVETNVAHVGVGEIFVVAGQSNAANHGEEKQKPSSDLVVAFSGKGWQIANDPQPGASGSGGSFLPPFGDAMAAQFKVPIGLVAVGVGATSVREWLPRGIRFPEPPTLTGNVTRLETGDWESKGTLFANLAARLKQLGPHGFRALLWHQGESDANQQDSTRTLSGGLYQRFLEQLIRDSRREAGWEFPWFVAQASYHTPDDPGSPEIRAAQAALWKSDLAMEGPDSDALGGDLRDGGGKGVHFSGKGLRVHGTKWAEKIAPWLQEQLTAASKPKAARAQYPKHWAFQPISRPAPPKVAHAEWPRSSLDRFILSRLEDEGLTPALEADRMSWLRRVSFDLVGLPPSPEQVEAFLKNSRDDAYARMVDELLASPRYGERWAQHWLDVVRYADTHGFEVNTERPNAWPYRDYVIRAFNRDTPYDQFIREQLAGDAFGQDAATGFLVTASVLLPGQIGADDVSKRLARQDSLDEIVVNTSQTFLGLSVGCARCHDHKFDPITARDYYSMQAFFAGVEYGDRELNTPDAAALRTKSALLKNRIGAIEAELARLGPLAHVGLPQTSSSSAQLHEEASLPLRPAVNAAMNAERFPPVKTKRLRFTIRETNNLEPCVDELEVFNTDAKNVALASTGTKATSSGDTTVTDRHELRFVNDGKYGNSHSWMSSEKGKGWVVLDFTKEQMIERVVWGRDREGQFTDRLATNYLVEVADSSGEWHAVADASDRRAYLPGDKSAGAFSTAGLNPEEAKRANALLAEKKDLEAKIVAMGAGQIAFAGSFRKPDVIHLLNRGDPEQPKDEAAPAVPGVMGDLRLPSELPEQQRRVALANWIASPQNPLTSRVMVNRIWQGHFGAGLVETPSDFGRNGARASHPELLDWLASEFVRSGWSIKAMHRLIVLSATYRQSSRYDPSAANRDADSRLLWRFPPRRLEAEAIRDSMLAASGRLNLKMGGPGFNLFNNRGGLSGFAPVESFTGDGLRRMIYAHKVRREREAVFGAFDCPDAGQSTARRRESTTPIQALNLFNSRFTLDQTDAFAARVKSEAGDGVAGQIHRVYQLALSRIPTATELADSEPVVAAYGLNVLCRALFNSNEFLFLP